MVAGKAAKWETLKPYIRIDQALYCSLCQQVSFDMSSLHRPGAPVDFEDGFKRNMFMFRNLIMPCAPRSQGQNQTECVTVYLPWDLPTPGTLGSVYAQKFCNLFRARSNSTSSRKAFWSPQQGAFLLLQNPQLLVWTFLVVLGIFSLAIGVPVISILPFLLTCEFSRAATMIVSSLYRTWKRTLWL